MVKINIFQSLLAGKEANPQQQIAKLPLLTNDEEQFLEEWNFTEVDHPQVCIHKLFAQQAEQTPKAIALKFAGQELTYQELDQRANQLAHHLQKKEVQHGELVGICVERSLEMVIGMLGILKAGAAYVPIDPEYPQERLDFILEDTQVSLLLTQEKWLQRIPQPEHLLETICLDSQWDTIAQNSSLQPICEASVDSLIYVIYTSGSTGKPKGVMVLHRGICNMLHWKQSNFALVATDKVLQTYPFSFDASVCQIFWPLCFGAQLVIARPDGHKDTCYLVDIINQEQITILGLVPAILRFLLEESDFKKCHSLRHVVCGGEALGIELVRRFHERLNSNHILQNEYGPTEASMVTTYWSCIDDSNYTVSPIGRPIDNFQIYVLDKNLQKVPFGESGELHIGGVGLANGYLNRPELTAEKFISNPFSSQPNARLYKTGDLVRYLPDGNLEFLGRIDNQVKIRGFRIELGEIDAILAQHPAVKETTAIVREDTPGEQCLVAYIVLRSPQPSPSELRSFVGQHLPEYMVPNTFVFIDSMPLTHNGKVDRRALPAPTKSDVGSETNFVSPNNSIEETLVTIWSDILGVESIGIHDNFFELGGHSLLLAQVMSRCRQAFSIEIPLQSLFEKPTIAELAAIIAQSQSPSQPQNDVAQYQAIPRCQNRDNIPLSFAQQRLWLLDRLEPNSAFYNVPVAVRLQGNLNISALQKALNGLVSHHEILRTNYISEQGNPIQIIKAPQSVELQIIDLQQYEHIQQEIHLQKLLKQEIHRPFDLASDKMLRGCLLQLAPQQYVFLLVMHHIASDGWSIDIIWQHLAELYRAFLENKPNPLAELLIQYADYAVWQKASLTNEVLERQLQYWKRQLMSVKPVLEIPTDRPRPPVQTYRGANQSVTISKALTRSLKELCQQEDATLYMALLAAFQTLLCRYSRQQDIIVGSPIAGRDRTEVENLIGFFVNTLVLRTDFSGNPSFQEVLRRVRKITLDAYDHQDLPFDKLVEAISPERSLSYNSLFQIMFVLQNAGKQDDCQLMGLTKTDLQFETETAKFDLTLSVLEQDGMLVSTWNYNTDLFDAITIERMMEHFETLLTAIVANPQQQIAKLPLLTQGEEQFLEECNLTEVDHPQVCIHELFAQQVERMPNAIAVKFAGQELTYQELDQRANQLAHHLHKLKVQSGELVGICIERSLEMIIGMLGILKAGAAYVPIDPEYPQERWDFIVDDTQISVLLTQAKWLGRTNSRQQLKTVCLDSDWAKIAQNSQIKPESQVTIESPIYVIYTSGSTGKPKGVVVPHSGICNMVHWKQSNYQLSAADKVLQTYPFSFDASVCQIFWPLCFGGQLIMARPDGHKDTSYLVTIIQKEKITILGLVPSILRFLLEETGIENCRSLKHVVCGGEALGIELVKHFYERFPLGNVLQNEYGPTEASMVTSFWQCDRESDYQVSPIGRAIDNFQLYVLDENLERVALGHPGELHIGGAGLARGYLNRPELTAERFIEHPFSQESGARLYKTGDLVRYLPDGNLEFLGRIDNQVKVRGFRIELGEIETLLSQHPKILEVAVTTKDNTSGDKRLIAYTVAQAEPPSADDLRFFLEERLPSYMVPSAFVHLDTIPLTANGKVDYRALSALEISKLDLEESHVSARNNWEKQLLEIWEEVLGVSPIGITDSFFELGGSSLSAVKLFIQVEKIFGQKIPFSEIFQASTVEKFALLLAREKSPAKWTALVSVKSAGTKPPLFCIHSVEPSILHFRHIGKYLDRQQPFYCLQQPALGDREHSIFHKFEDMAAHYIQEMRMLQPEGPYFLLGHSMGGLLAYEIARQLENQDCQVAFLGLIDTFAPGHQPRPKTLASSILYQLYIHGLNLSRVSARRKVGYILERMNQKIPRFIWNNINKSRWFISESTSNDLPDMYQNLPLYRPIKAANYEAYRAYATDYCCSGNIILYRAIERPTAVHYDPLLGWDKLIEREIEICDVPGQHNSVVHEPNAKILGKKIQAHINEIISGRQS